MPSQLRTELILKAASMCVCEEILRLIPEALRLIPETLNPNPETLRPQP